MLRVEYHARSSKESGRVKKRNTNTQILSSTFAHFRICRSGIGILSSILHYRHDCPDKKTTNFNKELFQCLVLVQHTMKRIWSLPVLIPSLNVPIAHKDNNSRSQPWTPLDKAGPISLQLAYVFSFTRSLFEALILFQCSQVSFSMSGA